MDYSNFEVIYAFCGVPMLGVCFVLIMNKLKFLGIASYAFWLGSIELYFNVKSDLSFSAIAASLFIAGFGFYTLHKNRLWCFEKYGHSKR
jgi:hypothetical protein